MRFVATLAMIFLSACGVESVTEDMKMRQAFNIYTVGNYSFTEICPEPGYIDGNISIGKDVVIIGHTVCNITEVEFSSEPMGPKVKLENCRSDGGNEDPASIIVESIKGGKIILHGWGDKSVQIFECPKKLQEKGTEK